MKFLAAFTVGFLGGFNIRVSLKFLFLSRDTIDMINFLRKTNSLTLTSSFSVIIIEIQFSMWIAYLKVSRVII